MHKSKCVAHKCYKSKEACASLILFFFYIFTNSPSDFRVLEPLRNNSSLIYHVKKALIYLFVGRGRSKQNSGVAL